MLSEQVPTVYRYASTVSYRYNTLRVEREGEGGGKGVEVEFAFFFFL